MSYYDGFDMWVQSDEAAFDYEQWIEAMEDAFSDVNSYEDYFV